MKKFVDVHPDDHHYFINADGSTYLPIGCNICFFRNSHKVSNETVRETYRKWFTSFAANGGNYVRIWLGVPFFDCMPEKPGVYDEQILDNIRFVIKLGEELGIKIKFTFEHFRRIGKGKDIEAYNGVASFDKELYCGIVNNMDEYLDSEYCRQIYLDRARKFAELGFGDSPAVICWELWNEINCIAHIDKLEPWCNYMISELQKIFPKQMIVSNIGSFSLPSGYMLYDHLARLPEQPFLQVHRYMDPGAEIEACLGPMDVLCFDSIRELRDRNNDCPLFLAEVGATEANHSCYSHMYKIDSKGTLLHDEIFAPFFAGSAGTGQPWHWDYIYIDQHDLWYHFGIFKKALEGIDPAAEKFVPFHTSTPRLRVYGLRGKNTILYWCRDKESNWQYELIDGKEPQLISGEEIPAELAETEHLCYLPWEDRYETAVSSVRKHYGATCVLPDFKRSIVVRVNRSK